jgi:hypothetical protein
MDDQICFVDFVRDSVVVVVVFSATRDKTPHTHTVLTAGSKCTEKIVNSSSGRGE